LSCKTQICQGGFLSIVARIPVPSARWLSKTRPSWVKSDEETYAAQGLGLCLGKSDNGSTARPITIKLRHESVDPSGSHRLNDSKIVFHMLTDYASAARPSSQRKASMAGHAAPPHSPESVKNQSDTRRWGTVFNWVIVGSSEERSIALPLK